MRVTTTPLASVVGLIFAANLSKAAEAIPTWAYGTENPVATTAARTNSRKGAPPDTGAKHLAGSALIFTRTQINDPFGPADWFSGDHPAMPDVVAHGRKPDIWACALCHYPNGKGRPENAGVAGLPVSYFIHQMSDFKDGLRRSTDERKKNTNLMITYAKEMTGDEIRAAAEYFGSMKWTPWIRVVETDTVPKTRLSVGMYLPLEGSEKEPLGQRIIEVPAQPDHTEELRDPRSGFIAYAPFGSIKKGELLAATGGEKTIACAACHGPGLKGLGPVPGIAGRSPSYVVRQMYDMQQNNRHGEWTTLMKPVVSRLSNEDMLNLAAYIASLEP